MATRKVTRSYGPQATPHAFLFDQKRRLRYEVAVKHTGVFGCSTRGEEKAPSRIEALRKIEAQPVRLEIATAADLKTLRTNPSKQMLLVSFWATWCGSCIAEFADLEDTYRMYSVLDLELVTVSTNMPDETNSVMKLLETMRATSRNLLFASSDTASLQAAFDPKWESAVPCTVLLAPGGKVLYQKQR